MEELLNARKETVEVRQETGALDLKPGEAQGLRADGGVGSRGKAQSAAMAKRKKELEERRNMIQTKRRKLAGNGARSGSPSNGAPTSGHADTPISVPPSSSAPGPNKANMGDPFAVLEAQASAAPDPLAALEATSKPTDPFAAFEQKASRPSKSRWDKRPAPDVDSFLADVEKELVSGKR